MSLPNLSPIKKLRPSTTIVILSLLVIFLLILKGLHPSEAQPSPNESLPASQQASVEPGLPKYIKISAINVSAAIESVGLTPTGDVDSPKDPNNAAWYNLGPKPGQIGSSVMDGHFGWKGDIPAVFDDLSKLRPGDKVQIVDEVGNSTIFVVRELRDYGPNEIVESVFVSNDNLSHLNLITCAGVWNKTEKSYSQRLVVYTDKE